MQYRQGDILIERVDSIPEDAKVKAGNVLAEGEVTGHSHRVHGKSVAVLEYGTDLYIRVDEEPAKVLHEEHNTVTLPPGSYMVRRQREWDPYAEAVRRVAD